MLSKVSDDIMFFFPLMQELLTQSSLEIQLTNIVVITDNTYPK